MASALELLLGGEWYRLRYGIAVSGGADSMALLDLMNRLLPGKIRAATVDHGLRRGSAEEAAVVAKWCQETGIDHQILAPERPIAGSIQAQARIVRYALLDQWRQREGLACIVTAHHADDQIETMIMRLNRASGVGGLAGVRARQGAIIRPLLGWRRAELAQWAKDHRLPVAHDPSNTDLRFDRARLRQAIDGQQWIDVAAAAQSAMWLDQADQALDWAVDRLIGDWPDASDSCILRDEHYPDEIFRRIVKKRLLLHQPEIELRGAALDGVISAMRGGQRAMIGHLLIDPAPKLGISVWRISAAPRRRTEQK